MRDTCTTYSHKLRCDPQDENRRRPCLLRHRPRSMQFAKYAISVSVCPRSHVSKPHAKASRMSEFICECCLRFSLDGNTIKYTLCIGHAPTSSSLRITDRSFQYASPRLWNQLPASLRQPRTNHSQSDSSLPTPATSSSIADC